MSDLWREPLGRLEEVQDGKVPSELKEWLRSPDIEPLSGDKLETTVSKVHHVWNVRWDIVRSKGGYIEGAKDLLTLLQALPANTKLEQATFTGSGHMVNIFFKKRSRSYVGFVFFKAGSDREELRKAS